jgi:MFS family permease
VTLRSILYAAVLLRSTATGLIGVLFGIYLAQLGLPPARIGLIIAVGLIGAAVAALIVTFYGDHFGRRSSLFTIALLTGAGGAAVALVSNDWLISLAAFIGMINGMGRDRGAAQVIEQALLPATTTDQRRTRTFAWYNVLQDSGHAAGSLLAGLPALFNHAGFDELAALRGALLVYALLQLATALFYARLPKETAGASVENVSHVSSDSRRVLWKISSLFALDSIGGGFLTTSLLSFFFFERFHVGAGTIGLLFAAARVANAFSHLGAAWLASRIGLVNTMVFTHIPSSLLLVTVAVVPSFPIAAALFLLRESLVEMDVPTRQSYVMAVVRPEERTLAAGVTHLVRLGGWAMAPAAAGVLMQGVALSIPLLIGAGMKISYDVLLYTAFRTHKPPEELAA